MDTPQPAGTAAKRPWPQDATPFGALLRGHREAAGLTQEELAERAGLTAKGISALERGERRRPYQDTVTRLAAALALSGERRATFEAAARGRPAAADAGSLPVAYAAPPPYPLVGRARERALLLRHLAGEGPPILMLAGEPGIGKTRLLREAATVATRTGWTLLQGGCSRQGGDNPFSPLAEALAQGLQALTPGRAREALRGCAWLVRLLPEIAALGAEPPPTWSLAPEQERRLIFTAAGALLANLAGPSGTLLVLDDLHWAGADALDMLASLAHAALPAPLRVLAAYRTTAVRPEDPLAVGMADLAHAGLATHVSLVPLAPAETNELLDTLLVGTEAGPDWRERVARQAEGVPFYLVSYIQAMRGGAAPATAKGVPWDVTQSVRQRVAALPASAREALRWAALIGRLVDPDLLQAVAGLADDELFTTLEAAAAAGLLVETERGYSFSHDLIREVIEADIGLARRQFCHKAIGEALEVTGDAAVEALAYHYSRSNTVDQALRYLDLAGDRAWLGCAPAAAERYFQALVERLEGAGGAHPGSGRAVATALARTKLGGVLFTLARYEAAQAALEPAAQSYRLAGDLEHLADLTSRIASILVERGRPAEAMARLETVLRLVEQRGPSLVLAQLNGSLAHLLFHSGRLAEALAVSERSVALARTLGNEYLLAMAQLSQGNALRMMGRVAEARPLMEEAVRRAEAIGEPTCLLFALDNTTWVAMAMGAFSAARGHNARACAIAELLNAPAQVAGAIAVRGAIAFLLGEWAGARRDLEAAVATYRQIDAARLSAYPLAELGRLCLATGEADAASAYLEECLAIARSGHDLQAQRLAQGVLAEQDLLSGRPSTGRDRLLPLLDRPGLQEWQVTELLPNLAWANLELGDLAEAAGVATTAIERARAQANLLSLVRALRISALIALGARRLDDAAAALDEALALARRMPYPHGEARVLHALALLHLARAEPQPARACRREADAIYRRLGATVEVAG